MNSRKSIYLLLFATSAAGTALAQDVAATASLSSSSIQVGDAVKLRLEVSKKPEAAQVTWAPIADSFGKIEVLETGKIDTLSQNGRTLFQQQISVTAFDSGRFVIPPFRFEITPRTGSGAAYTLVTDSLPLLVQTLPVDTTQPFRPIKDVMKVPLSWRDYIWYGVMVFGALLLGLLFFYYLKKKRKAAAAPPPPENISDKTMRLLRALAQKKLWQQGEEGVKAYYVELTELVRSYIEIRFGIKALEQTTDEFLQQAKNHRELKTWSHQLFTLLHTADMAKFARAQPSEQQHEQAMQAAMQLVQQSRPVIVDASVNKPM